MSDKPLSGGATPTANFTPDKNYLPGFRRANIQGSSHLDEGRSYIYNEDVNESRAQRQSTSEKAFNGIAKGVGLAGTTFAHTFTALPLGLAIATGRALDGKGFTESVAAIYDNPIAHAFDAFNKNMEEWLPNYYTQEEINAHAFSPDNWFTANFLFDKFIKNAGFTVGAIGSGAVVSKGLYGLGKLAMSGKYAKESMAVTNLIQKGYTIEQALAKVGSGLKTLDTGVKFGAAMAAAAGEGSIEALETKEQTFQMLLEKFVQENGQPSLADIEELENRASAAGNSVFAANLAILGTSDLIQFGKILGTGYKNELKRLAATKGNYTMTGGVATAKTFGKLSRAANVAGGPLKGMATEAAEEGSQVFSSSSSMSFAARKYDNESIKEIDNLILSVGDGLGKTFGSKEGLESMLLGALTGIGSRVATGQIAGDIRANSQRDKDIAATVTMLNSYKAKSAFGSAYDASVSGVSIAKDMEKAIESGNIYEYKNLQNDLFKDYVNSRIQTGRFDLLVDELEDLKNLNPQEFSAVFGVDKTESNLVNQYVDKLIGKAKKLNSIAEDIDIRFPKASQGAKQYLYYNLADIQDVNKRMSELSTEVELNSTEGGGVGISPEAILSAYPADFKNILEEQYTKLVETNAVAANNIKEALEDYMKLLASRKVLLDTYKTLISPEADAVVAKKEKDAKKEAEAAAKTPEQLAEEEAAKKEKAANKPVETPATADDVLGLEEEEDEDEEPPMELSMQSMDAEKASKAGTATEQDEAYEVEEEESFDGEFGGPAPGALVPAGSTPSKATHNAKVGDTYFYDGVNQEVIEVFDNGSIKILHPTKKLQRTTISNVDPSLLNKKVEEKKEEKVEEAKPAAPAANPFGQKVTARDNLGDETGTPDEETETTAPPAPVKKAAPKAQPPVVPPTTSNTFKRKKYNGKPVIKGPTFFNEFVKNSDKTSKEYELFERAAKWLSENPDGKSNFVMTIHNTYAKEVKGLERVYAEYDNGIAMAKSTGIDIKLTFKTDKGEAYLGYFPYVGRFVYASNGTRVKIENMTPTQFIDTFNFKGDSIAAERAINNYKRASKLWEYLEDQFKDKGEHTVTFADIEKFAAVEITSSFIDADYTDRPKLVDVKGFNHNGDYFIMDTYYERMITPNFPSEYPDAILDKVRSGDMSTRYIAMYNKPGAEKLQWVAVKPAELGKANSTQLIADVNGAIKKLNARKEVEIKDARIDVDALADYFIAGENDTYYRFQPTFSKGASDKLSLKINVTKKTESGKFIEKDIFIDKMIGSVQDLVDVINDSSNVKAKTGEVFTTIVDSSSFKTSISKAPQGVKSADLAKKFDSTIEDPGNLQIKLNIDSDAIDRKPSQAAGAPQTTNPSVIPTSPAKAPVTAANAPVNAITSLSDDDIIALSEEVFKKELPNIIKAVGFQRLVIIKNARANRGQADTDITGGKDMAKKVSSTEARKLIDMTSARNWINQHLPDSISVQDLNRVIDKLEVNGIPFGAFADKVVYLSTKAESGTEYHEAFHAVFRALLSDAQIAKYYKVASETYGEPSIAEIDALLKVDPSAARLSDQELANLVLEEKMADAFMEYVQSRSTASVGFFRALFRRLMDFIRGIMGMRGQVEMLFKDISRGAFKQSKVVENRFSRAKFAYKIVPGLDFNTSKQVVGDIVAKLVTKGDISVYTLGDAIEREMDIKAKMYDGDNPMHYDGLDSPDYIDKLLSRADAFTNPKARSIIKEEVAVKMLDLISKEDISDEDRDDELNEIGERNWEFEIFENGGFDSVSKEIRNFIRTTAYQVKDEFGHDEYLITNEIGEDEIVPVEKQVDYAVTYSAMEMMLASKELDQMLPLLESAAIYNPQIEAIMKRLREKTGYHYNSATGETTFDVPHGELFMNKFVKTFEKEKVKYIHIETDITNASSRIFNANQKDPKQDLADDWARAFEIDYVRRTSKEWGTIGAEIAKLGNMYQSGTLATNIGIETAVLNFKASMAKVGINLPEGLIHYSITNYKPTMDLNGKDSNIGVIDPETLFQLANIIRKDPTEGNNPFQSLNREVAGKDTAMLGRLLSLAELSVPYDGGIITPSFQGADGKMRYSYIRPSEFLTRNREIALFREEDKRARAISENEYYADNYLLTDDHATEIFSKLDVAFTGDIREKSSEKGVTFKDIDPKAFQVMQHTLFMRDDKINSVSNKRTYARFYTMVMESSSTAFATTLPVEYTKFYNGQQITKDGMDVLYNKLFMTEYKRIKRQQQEIDRLEKSNKKALIKNYQTRKKNSDGTMSPARGETFTDMSFLERVKIEVAGQETTIGDIARSTSPNKLAAYAPHIKQAIKIGIEEEINAEMVDAIKNKLITGKVVAGKAVLDSRASVTMQSGLSNEGIDSIIGFKNPLVSKDGSKTNMIRVPNMTPQERMQNYFGTFVLNTFISTTSVNQLVLGDSAMFKDDTDVVKRAKGMIASGESLYSPFTTTRGAQGLANDQFYSALIEDPLRYVDPHTAIAYKPTDQFYIDNKDKKKFSEQEVADAQSWVTVRKKINDLKALGRLSPEGLENLERVAAGDETYTWTSEEVDGFVLNSDKNVYYDENQVYKKDSELVLDPLMTSMRDANGNWVARPGREFLHNLREWMEKNDIEKTNTASGSKGKSRHVLDFNEASTRELSPEERESMISSRKNQRLQVETPSGKTKVVYGTQLMQLIDSELDDDHEVVVDSIKGISNMRELRSKYRELLATSRGKDYSKIVKVLGTLKDGYKFTRQDDKFFKKLQESLRASGASESMIEMFAPGSNPNLPHTLAKFEQLFLAHFKGAFKQKVAGLKSALVSPLGFEVLVNAQDEVITQGQIEDDFRGERTYFNEDGSLKTGEDVMFTTRPLKSHRVSIDGRTIHYGEVVMPLWSKDLYNLEKGMDSSKMSPEVRDEILTMMGIRIPTQSQHSMFHFKVVDFLPPHYGSVVVVPAEISYLAGSDFDIDSMFIYRKDYWKDNDGKFHVHKNGKSEDEMFADYRSYNLRDSYVKDTIADIKANDNGYKKLLYRERLSVQNIKVLQERIDAVNSTIFDKQDEIDNLQEAFSPIQDESVLMVEGADIPTESSTPKETQKFYEEYLTNAIGEIEARIKELTKKAVIDNGLIIDFKNDLKKYSSVKREYEAHVQNQALKMNNIATTKEEYLALDPKDQMTNAIINNQLLDLKLAILTSGSTWEAGKTPATMDSMKEAARVLFKEVRQLNESTFVRTGPTGLRSSWNNNAVGKKNVGPWANVNAVSAMLTRHNVALSPVTTNTGDVVFSIPIIDGIYFGSYEHKEELDIMFDETDTGVKIVEYDESKFEEDEAEVILGQGMIRYRSSNRKDKADYYRHVDSNTMFKKSRKADSLSTGVSSMTDNAKERLAALLNITIKTSSTVAAMEALGMGTMRASLIASQESIRLVSEKASQGGSAISTVKDNFDVEASVMEDITTTLVAIEKKIDSHNNASEEKIEKPSRINPDNLTSQMLLDALYTETKRDNGFEIDLLEEHRYTAIQLAAIQFYKNVNYTSQDVGRLAKLSKLNKGLPTTIADAEDIYKAAVELGFINEYTTHSPSFDAVNTIGVEDPNLMENINRLKEVLNVLTKSYFIGKTPFALDIRREILGTELNTDRLKKIVPEQITKDIVSFLTVRTYEKIWNERNPNSPVNLGGIAVQNLIHPNAGKTLAEEMVDLRKRDKVFSRNKFIQFLDDELTNATLVKRDQAPLGENIASVDTITGDTRRKLTPEYENDLIDSYRELQDKAKYSAEVVSFSQRMFLYLIIKDNLQFKNKSFINFIDPSMYKDVTDGLNQLIAELSKPIITTRATEEGDKAKTESNEDVNEETSELTEEDEDSTSSIYQNESEIERLTGKNTAALKDDFIRRFMRYGRMYEKAKTTSLEDITVLLNDKEGKPYNAGIKTVVKKDPMNKAAIEYVYFDMTGGISKRNLRFFKPYYSPDKLDKHGNKLVVGVKAPRFIKWKEGESTIVLELKLDKQPASKVPILRANGSLVVRQAAYYPTSALGGKDWKIMHFQDIEQIERTTADNQASNAAVAPAQEWQGGWDSMDSMDIDVEGGQTVSNPPSGSLGRTINPDEYDVDDPNFYEEDDDDAPIDDDMSGEFQRRTSKREMTAAEAQNILEHLSSKFGIDANIVNDANLPWAGMFKNGQAYINIAKAKVDTPFHEFMHPFLTAIKLNNVPLYNNLVSQIMSTPEGQGILAYVSDLYTDEAGYTNEDRIDEAIVQAIGEFASDSLERETGLWAAIKRFFERLAQFMNEFMGERNVSPSELASDLTLRDLGQLIGLNNNTKINLDFVREMDEHFQKEEENMLTDLEQQLMNQGLLRITCRN